MTDEQIRQFVKERDAAVLTLDRAIFREFY